MLGTKTFQLGLIEQGLFGGLAKYGNIILVSTIGVVLAMMIIPMPAPILDLLLAINIVGALTILLVAISVTDPMKIATFPTLLLVATLFRLGLNIASTRLVLADGYAGEIIQTFGHFATRGNLAVGLIMFLILTIVQFVVIAKGAERVAEVAARFTLDALPGKQMSIDADLRAGIIAQEEAKSLRDNLHRESKLYGSMDGAMKFVKGDAIAGLVITVINIIGGLYMGVVQRGLPLSEAANTYSILTIGDGLVSQLPALLMAMTAGLVVTRVADEKSQNSLGADMGIQIFSQPRAILMASTLAFFIGMIPGFPFLLFCLISFGLAGCALYLMHTVRKKLTEPAPVGSFLVGVEKQILEQGAQALPLVVEVGPELYQIFQEDPRWTHCLGTLYPKLKLHLSGQMGVLFPDLKILVSESLKKTFRYHIRIYDVPADYGILTPQYCAFVGDQERLSGIAVEKPTNTTETVHGTKVALWDVAKKEALSQRGIPIYGPEEMLLRHLARMLKKHAADFISIQEVRNTLTMLEGSYPELVREVIPKMMSIQKLTEIVKRLVEEGIPIKDFRLILQTLSCAQPESKDPVTLTEQVRMGLRRMITFMHVREGMKLPVVTLDAALEDEIRNAIQKNGQECYLALPPDRLQAIVEAFRQTFFTGQITSRHCVVLTQLEIRRYVRKIIEEDLSDLAVLSYQELDPRVMIQPMGTISFDGLASSTEALAVNE